MASRKDPHPEEAAHGSALRAARGQAPQPSRRTHSADPAEAGRVCVGVVTGPQGVQGAVRIKSFTEVPEDIAGYGPLRDEARHHFFEVQVCGTAKGVLIA